jgi:hypothetical protein
MQVVITSHVNHWSLDSKSHYKDLPPGAAPPSEGEGEPEPPVVDCVVEALDQSRPTKPTDDRVQCAGARSTGTFVKRTYEQMRNQNFKNLWRGMPFMGYQAPDGSLDTVGGCKYNFWDEPTKPIHHATNESWRYTWKSLGLIVDICHQMKVRWMCEFTYEDHGSISKKGRLHYAWWEAPIITSTCNDKIPGYKKRLETVKGLLNDFKAPW